jgi:hypothetical protein
LAEFERTYINRFRIAELGAENWPGATAGEKPGQS